MSDSSTAFSVGDVVRHLRFKYRGVIVDVDAQFSGTEEWYEMMARSRPPKDRPWYHVLVHGADHSTYVAERHLVLDASGEQVDLTHANRAMCGAGCDLEIVAVEIGNRPFWSLAFAAFGPEDGHVESIRAAWHSQCLDRPWPLPTPLVSDNSCGYPEWLVSVNPD